MNKSDKFVVKKNHSEIMRFKPVAVRMSTFETIQEMRELTGYSVVEIMEKMVNFCFSRLEIIDDAEDEI